MTTKATKQVKKRERKAEAWRERERIRDGYWQTEGGGLARPGLRLTVYGPKPRGSRYLSQSYGSMYLTRESAISLASALLMYASSER